MTINQLTMRNLAPRGITGSCVPTTLAFVTGACYQDIEYVLTSEQPKLYRPDIKGNSGVDTNKLLSDTRILFGHRFTRVHVYTPNSLIVRDLPETYPNGTYILQIPKHLLAIRDGQFFDLNDVKYKSEVGSIWKVEKLS